MSYLNKIQIIGNIGGEPELRQRQDSQMPVATFRVASTRRYRTASGERREETEWFTVSAWNKLADVVMQLAFKGQKVYVEGRLSTQRWTRDGQENFRLHITASDFQALSFKPRTNGDADAPAPADVPDMPDDEDIPF